MGIKTYKCNIYTPANRGSYRLVVKEGEVFFTVHTACQYSSIQTYSQSDHMHLNYCTILHSLHLTQAPEKLSSLPFSLRYMATLPLSRFSKMTLDCTLIRQMMGGRWKPQTTARSGPGVHSTSVNSFMKMVHNGRWWTAVCTCELLYVCKLKWLASDLTVWHVVVLWPWLMN